MPYPRQLVTAIAESFGIPEATVALHDRLLAEAGLRTSGGRGRSAAKVNTDDAANLLIAVAAEPITGPTVRDSAQTVRKYALLPAWAGFPLDKAGDWASVPGLNRLPP